MKRKFLRLRLRFCNEPLEQLQHQLEEVEKQLKMVQKQKDEGENCMKIISNDAVEWSKNVYAILFF